MTFLMAFNIFGNSSFLTALHLRVGRMPARAQIYPVVLSNGQPEPLSLWLKRLEYPDRLTGSLQ
jgi:hypothetical protein